MKFDDVKKMMIEDGTYKPSFDETIKAYCEIYKDYKRTMRISRKKENQKPFFFFGETGVKANPYPGELRALRMQLSKFQTMLLLSPQSQIPKKQASSKTKSGFETALESLGGF
jgi:phage terminase small subunit